MESDTPRNKRQRRKEKLYTKLLHKVNEKTLNQVTNVFSFRITESRRPDVSKLADW